MSIASKAKRLVQESAALALNAARHPALSLRQALLTTMRVRGADTARTWPTDGVPAATEAPPNPLWDYFQSRPPKSRGLWKWVHYFDVYHRHLARFVGREVHVVEIGVLGGGSVDMWLSYFGPQCQYLGVDIDPACAAYAGERARIVIGDQADRAFWGRVRATLPRIDVVLDDGGHEPEQQLVTLQELLPHVTPGGVYICEDIHGAGNPFAAFVHGLADELNDIPPAADSTNGAPASAAQDALDSVHLYPFMAVIEKATRPRGRLVAERRGGAGAS